MKIQIECVPCLLKRIVFEAEQSTKDKDLLNKTVKNACKLLSELFDPNISSATIATKVHRIAYDTLGNNDPYFDLKKQSNDIAKSLQPRLEELIENSDDPLKTSMVCSIIGNMLDFGIEGGSSHPDMLKNIFDKIYSEGLGQDDYEILLNIINIINY